MVKPYIAEYKCLVCKHQYEVIQGDYGCPEGYEGDSCAAGDPALCKVKKADSTCWGCSPCGRSRRQYRCAACGVDVTCPACGNHVVKWINYEALFDLGSKPRS